MAAPEPAAPVVEVSVRQLRQLRIILQHARNRNAVLVQRTFVVEVAVEIILVEPVVVAAQETEHETGGFVRGRQQHAGSPRRSAAVEFAKLELVVFVIILPEFEHPAEAVVFLAGVHEAARRSSHTKRLER